MGKAGNIFLIVLGVLFFSQTSLAQHSIQKIDWNKTAALHVNSAFASTFQHSLAISSKPFFPASGQDLNLMQHPTLQVAKDMYVKNLAFFCRQELRVEKTIKIPLKFRMGSLAQANALEGK